MISFPPPPLGGAELLEQLHPPAARGPGFGGQRHRASTAGRGGGAGAVGGALDTEGLGGESKPAPGFKQL